CRLGRLLNMPCRISFQISDTRRMKRPPGIPTVSWRAGSDTTRTAFRYTGEDELYPVRPHPIYLSRSVRSGPLGDSSAGKFSQGPPVVDPGELVPSEESSWD